MHVWPHSLRACAHSDELYSTLGRRTWVHPSDPSREGLPLDAGLEGGCPPPPLTHTHLIYLGGSLQPHIDEGCPHIRMLLPYPGARTG